MRSVDIYDKDRYSIRGKDTKKKTDTVYLESVYKPSDTAQHTHIDIFFMYGEGYLISVLTPLDFAMISRIKNRTSDSLQTALFHHLAIAESENYEITHILCDGEKVFLPSSINCVPQDISLIPQDQVSTCLLSKEISERIRVYLQSIPYQLMFSLLRYCDTNVKSLTQFYA